MDGREGRVKLEEKESRMMDLVSSPSSSDGSPLRPIFCLKKSQDMKRFEDIEDCFILDFDPFESVHRISSLSVWDPIDDSLSIVAEKGQVACRDYPHSRHLCLKYPFDSTLHEKFCNLDQKYFRHICCPRRGLVFNIIPFKFQSINLQCYCYVCDVASPCKYWTGTQSAHCHAAENIGDWKQQRNLARDKRVKGLTLVVKPNSTS